MLDAFKTWLKKWEYEDGTIQSRYSNCQHIEDKLGINLDDEFDADEMELLMRSFEYSKDDFNRGHSPRHGIHIAGNTYDGTATLRSALNLYYRFKKYPDDNPRTRHATASVKRCVRSHDGSAEIENAVQSLGIDLAKLIAKVALWAPRQAHVDCQNSAKYPNVRRKYPYEKRGVNGDGIRLDDNSYPNAQMKTVMNQYYKIEPDKYETCHIWPDTCHDVRYHTCFANLVLIPREIAALSDHNTHIQKVLQYRAFEIFGWYPEGEEKPVKPDNYPTEWLSLDD